MKKRLGLLLVFTCVLISYAFTQSITTPHIGQREPIWSSTTLKEYAEKEEIVAQRTQYSKHFRNADGSFTAIVTAGSTLNYQDASGQWQTIDTRIVSNVQGVHSNYDLANLTNHFKSYYATDVKKGTLIDLNGQLLKDGLNKRIVW